MRVHHFLTLHAAFAFVAGLGLLTAPLRLVGLVGPDLHIGGGLMAQLLGGSLLGMAVIGWAARDVADRTAARAIVGGLGVFNLTSLVILLLAQLTAVLKPAGWVLAALHLALALASGLALKSAG